MQWRIYYGLTFLLAILSREVQGQTFACYEIEAITIHDDDFEKDLTAHAIYYKDETRSLNFNQALNALDNCTFLSRTEIGKFPTVFTSGSCFMWSFFKIKNESNKLEKYVLSGSVERDSIWVLQSNNAWRGYYLTNNEFKKNNPDEKMKGYNRFVLSMHPKSEVFILFRQSKIHYNDINVLPKLSAIATYEREYGKRKHFITLFYLFSASVVLTILFFNLIYYLYFQWKVLILYSLYLVSTLFVLYRNYDWSSLYGSFTLGNLLWEDTRLIHTAAIFLSYAYFVVNFLEYKIPFGKRVLQVFTSWFLLSIVADIIFRQFIPQYSYWIYFISRMLISASSLLIIFLIWKSVHQFSKFVLLGTVVLITGELISNFLQGNQSSVVVTTSVLIELMIFTIVLGIWLFQNYSEQKNALYETEKQVAVKNGQLANIRKEFAQDLHDEIGSTVAKLSLETYFLKQKESIKSEGLEGIQNNLTYLANQIKEMVWLFQEEKTSFTELQAHIRTYAHDYLNNFPIELHLSMPDAQQNPQISLEIKRHLLAIVKEVLANIIKHSMADKVTISCEINEEKMLRLRIKDNGIGLANGPNANGHGLRNIQQRAHKINAQVSFQNHDGLEIDVILSLK